METGFARLHPPPSILRKPWVFRAPLIRALSAGIYGLSFLEFWSLRVSRRLSGDFGGPSPDPKNPFPLASCFARGHLCSVLQGQGASDPVSFPLRCRDLVADPFRGDLARPRRAASTGRTGDRTRPILHQRQKVLAEAPSTRAAARRERPGTKTSVGHYTALHNQADQSWNRRRAQEMVSPAIASEPI